jgi:hypothetical protein
MLHRMQRATVSASRARLRGSAAGVLDFMLGGLLLITAAMIDAHFGRPSGVDAAVRQKHKAD